jgi:hypothetical protein
VGGLGEKVLASIEDHDRTMARPFKWTSKPLRE